MVRGLVGCTWPRDGETAQRVWLVLGRVGLLSAKNTEAQWRRHNKRRAPR